MAEVFQNTQIRAARVTTSSSGGAIGITTNKITGVSTAGVSTGYTVDNSNYIMGTQVSGYGAATGEIVVDRDSTNTGAASNQTVKFLGPTTAFTSPAATKSILIGGTFANNTVNEINVSVGLWDNTAQTEAAIAQKIPVPQGSSFVISDTGKVLLEGDDAIRVYCDVDNAVDVNLSILRGVN